MFIRQRNDVIDMQLAACFPDRDAAWIKATRREFYRNFADVSVEIIKAVTMKQEEIDRRVTFDQDEPARAALDAAARGVIDERALRRAEAASSVRGRAI